MEKSSFSQTIRSARERCNLSLAQAAARMKITKAHIWEMERGGATNPTVQTLATMAEAYGVSATTLFRKALEGVKSEKEKGLV